MAGVGKRRSAREMAVQMLYQLDLGASSISQVVTSFDLAGYLKETEKTPPVELVAAPVPSAEAALAGDLPAEKPSGEEPPEPRRMKQARASFAYAERLVRGVVDRLDEIDDLIRQHAENWRLERMPAIDRNILRLAVHEMTEETGVPAVVIVDEAIELAKKFGSENSSRFVNGLLDGVLRSRRASRSASEGAA